MKLFLLVLLTFNFSHEGVAQGVRNVKQFAAPLPDLPGNDPASEPKIAEFTRYLRYADSHIHPTYKHYFRYRTDREMQLLLKGAKYSLRDTTIMRREWGASGKANSVTYKPLVGFDSEVVAHFKHASNSNWTPSIERKVVALQHGQTSKLRNYDQAGYPEIQFVPGSILCNSYSPYEKQFALKPIKRIISSFLVTGMGLPRLNAYGAMKHTPYDDFLAEYYFNLLQDEEKRVATSTPDSLYLGHSSTSRANPPYRNSIKMVRNAAELTRCLDHNDSVLASPGGWRSTTDEPLLYTPLLMSIEGAQVLYGTLSARNDRILKPLNVGEDIRDEILDNAVRIKNLPHRLFFITLGHFAQNHVVGFAKTLDRDPESLEHRAMFSITRNPRAKNSLFHKTYEGHNPCLGMEVATTFLDPNNTIHRKPTYVDVKHMDIRGRIEYYYRRRELEKELGIKIPIIASHFAVSGETQAMAAATGLLLPFDEYYEAEQPEEYYKAEIFQNDNPDERAKHWMNFMRGYRGKHKPKMPLSNAEKQVYRPLDFRISRAQWDSAAFDPFKGFALDPHKVGWYYPWSVNLFDEEIIEINKSDGIIGLLLDPRQLGAFMPNYQHLNENFGASFHRIKSSLSASDLSAHFLKSQEINPIEYFKVEPLLRNWFYIVQVLKRQRANEAIFAATGQRPAGFVPDPLQIPPAKRKDAWETVNIGSDFDGLIDPIDFAPTAAYVPELRRRLVAYAFIFAQIHPEFADPETGGPFLTSLKESDHRLQQLFYGNLSAFTRKYF